MPLLIILLLLLLLLLLPPPPAALQPTAAVRLRIKGGHGGHNGLRSIQQHFGGSQDFPRIKIGEAWWLALPLGKLPLGKLPLGQLLESRG
jgi:hypothetical protein